MTAHLTLPYNWEDCTNTETCEEHIHLKDTAENLNNYPVEWIEEFIGNCAILIKKDDTGATVTETIQFYDTNGELHSSSNQPAVIQHHNPEPGKLNHSQKEWYHHGAWHRDDGPAIECADGHQEWFNRGLFHREDGPAIENSNGYQEWWQNDLLHRENGPAIENADGTQQWWFNGTQYPNPPYT